jgi:ferredoxin--NADP+ reductase
LETNSLSGEPFKQKARGTGEKETLDASILFRSVGYRGLPLPGVPFHEAWGIFPNEEGRIVDGDKAVPGFYTVGWIKRGPSGVIGTNKPDSQATVKSLLADVDSLPTCDQPDTEAVKAYLQQKGIRIVSFDDWKRIDQAEIERGQAKGKTREKFTSADEMLACL